MDDASVQCIVYIHALRYLRVKLKKKRGIKKIIITGVSRMNSIE